MKKYSIIAIAAIVGASLLFSCSKEADFTPDENLPAQGEDNSEKENNDKTVMVFSASLNNSAETKTYITTPEPSGPNEGKYVPKWSSSDKIKVNGVESAVGDRSDDFTSASFGFSELVAGPYYAIAPSEENRTWDSENTRFSVVVKGTGAPQKYRNYTDGSSDNRGTNPTYDMSHAILAAYSEDTSLQFQQLTTYYKLSFKKGAGVGDGTKIKTIYIRQGESAATPNIAGTWRVSFDGSGVASIAPSTPTAIIAYNCMVNGGTATDGVDFGSPVIITLPSYNFENGLILTVKDTEDHFQSYSIPATSSNLALKKGTLITKTLTYSPQSGTINNAADWNAFAAAVNAEANDWDLYKWVGNGTVKLGADISAADLTKITNLKYTIDGQNHTITRTAATGALIGTIQGEVKNLTLAGAIDASSSPQLGALADILDAGGKITSVTNNMNITATAAADFSIGGIVQKIKGGTISGCINYGNINAYIDVTSSNKPLQVGGIVAVTSLTANAVIENCENHGAHTVTPSYNSKELYVQYGSLGGIIGAIPSKDYNIRIENCDNYETISWIDPHDWSGNNAGYSKIGAPKAACIGGIVGRAAPVKSDNMDTPNGTNGMKITLKDCDNSGNVNGMGVGYYGSVTAALVYVDEMGKINNKVYVGGLAGSLVGNSETEISVTNCTNEGNILPYDYYTNTTNQTYSSNQCGFSSVVGGLIGWGGYVNISGGSVSGIVGSKRRHAFCMAGVIGYAAAPFKISEMTVGVEGYFVPGLKTVDNVNTELTETNFAYFAAVPASFDGNALTPAVNISGSSITSCSVTHAIQTCDSQSFASSGSQGGSSKHWVNRTSDSSVNWVQGKGYATLATDVTIN